MGHYCWMCGRVRPNEKFSGSGHQRHLCRECAKRPREGTISRHRCRPRRAMGRSCYDRAMPVLKVEAGRDLAILALL